MKLHKGCPVEHYVAILTRIEIEAWGIVLLVDILWLLCFLESHVFQWFIFCRFLLQSFKFIEVRLVFGLSLCLRYNIWQLRLLFVFFFRSAARFFFCTSVQFCCWGFCGFFTDQWVNFGLHEIVKCTGLPRQRLRIVNFLLAFCFAENWVILYRVAGGTFRVWRLTTLRRWRRRRRWGWGWWRWLFCFKFFQEDIRLVYPWLLSWHCQGFSRIVARIFILL